MGHDLEQEVLFSPEELLIHVESTISSLKASEGNGVFTEAVAGLALGNLGTLCYTQGVLAAQNQGFKPDADGFYHAVVEGQKRWDMAVRYCRDTLQIEFHPLGMLMLLQMTCASEESGELEKFLAKGMERYISESSAQLEQDLNPGVYHRIPDAGSLSSDDIGLFGECFELMKKLGTFYRDRSSYESDEKREMHDRLMSIYGRIAGE